MDIKKTGILKHNRILITAGPTWVPIDSVRVISNTATGETGIILAQELIRLGARVTLLLGPGEYSYLNKKISLIRFRFFDELLSRIKKELKSKKYDIVIHSAAVSDYRSAIEYANKIKSGKNSLKLNLVPTLKIIDLIKKFDPGIFAVGFKFEPKAKKGLLIKISKGLLSRSNLDLAVGNSANKKYEAYIVGKCGYSGPFLNKTELAKRLVETIGDALCRN